MRTKATKKDWDNLRNNREYFPTAEVILFPNNTREIWIKNKAGTKGFRITASEGPAGFSLRIQNCVGDPPMTMSNTNYDTDYLELTMYNDDIHSYLHKLWYKMSVSYDDLVAENLKPIRENAKGIAEEHAQAYLASEKQLGYYQYLLHTGLLASLPFDDVHVSSHPTLWKRMYYERLKELLK